MQQTNFWSLVMNGLADVDGFKICIEVLRVAGLPTLVSYISMNIQMLIMNYREVEFESFFESSSRITFCFYS